MTRDAGSPVGGLSARGLFGRELRGRIIGEQPLRCGDAGQEPEGNRADVALHCYRRLLLCRFLVDVGRGAELPGALVPAAQRREAGHRIHREQPAGCA